jgi:(R,R)-butanediol dehydrogenase / meso-butanediol dehydrogenase / diacetyl reductase
MQALRYHGRGDVRLDDVPEPEPAAGEVKVRISHNGLCGTDVHEYFDGPIVHPVRPDPLTGARIPVGIGHEACGTVVGAGPGVDESLIGTRVAIDPVITCGACAACRRNEPTRCERFAVIGLSTALGALAEYVVVAAGKVHALDATVPFAQAALVEPIAVAHRAVARSRIGPADAVLVLGAGPIGIGVLLTLRALGHRRFSFSEPSAVRRACAERLGFTPIQPADAAYAVVIDAAGTQASFTTALASTRAGGTVMLVAIAPGALTFAAHPLVVAEKTIVTSIVYDPAEFATVVANMNRGAYGRDVWYEEIPLERYVPDGLEPSRAAAVTKVVVRVS